MTKGMPFNVWLQQFWVKLTVYMYIFASICFFSTIDQYHSCLLAIIRTFYVTIKVWIEHLLVTLNKRNNAQFLLNLTPSLDLIILLLVFLVSVSLKSRPVVKTFSTNGTFMRTIVTVTFRVISEHRHGCCFNCQKEGHCWRQFKEPLSPELKELLDQQDRECEDTKKKALNP